MYGVVQRRGNAGVVSRPIRSKGSTCNCGVYNIAQREQSKYFIYIKEH